MHYVRIENNTVTNVEEWEGQPIAQAGVTFIQTDARAIGDHYDPATGLFTTPAPVAVVPASVSMRQARLALLNAGLLTQVNAAMAAASEAFQIEWDYATDVERHRTVGVDIVGQMATQLGLTSAQVDALFVSAAAIP